MDKAQAIHEFWSGFGIPAFDENTVDETVDTPYISYSVATGSLENVILLTASIFYRSPSWDAITQKAKEIEDALTIMNPPAIKIDGGRLYLAKGSPFSQRMADEDPDIRRIVINVMAEFLTN